MDRDFKTVEGNVPFASNFEFSVPLAEGGTQRVLVQKASIAPGTGRVIDLKVAALIPRETTVTVRKSLFQANVTGTIESSVASDLDETLAVLASKALVSSNESLLGDPETAPVTDADRDTAAMRAILDAHLQQRQVDTQTLQDALTIYDTIPEAIVPSPKLRAALAALTGTFAEPAIASILTADNCTNLPADKVQFAVPPDNPKLLARVTYVASGARVISINPYAEGERIEHLMPILAHEAIHCDQEDGVVEEVAATAFDGFLYLQLVAADPTLANAKTRVARELNTDAMALINSGALIPESVGILPSVGVTSVLPGTNVTAQSFAEFVADAYPQIDQATSPTEPLASTYAHILAGVALMPDGDAFDLQYLDELLSRAMNGQVLYIDITAFELAPAG